MKRYLYLILMLSMTTLLLAGCFSIDQEMWINADESGKMKMDMGMSEALLSMAGDQASTNPVQDMEKELSPNPNIKNIKADEYSKDGMKHFVIQFDIVNFNKFIDEESKKSTNTDMAMTIKKLDNGNYLFVQKLNMGDAAGGADMSALGGVGGDMDNLFWTITMHVPSVVNTNGEKKGSDTVVWKIPVKDLLSGKAPAELSLEYAMKSSGFSFDFNFTPDPNDPASFIPLAVSCLCCLIILVIIIVVVVVVIRRKKQQ